MAEDPLFPTRFLSTVFLQPHPSDQTYTLTPAPEAIDQMKVITAPFSAEYGHAGGGVVLLTSNNGTNIYHGSVYDYFRNRVLNGCNFFQPAQSTIKYVQNDPGGTFGGPVRFPGYDGKNKSFFFTDFNVTLSSIGSAYSALVPTDLERSGNFSQSQAGTGFVTIRPHNGPFGAGRLDRGSQSISRKHYSCFAH